MFSRIACTSASEEKGLFFSSQFSTFNNTNDDDIDHCPKSQIFGKYNLYRKEFRYT